MTRYLSKSAALFAELIENDSILASAVDKGSRQTQALFATPIATEIVKKQRGKHGNRYQLLHKESLLTFLESEFPNGLLKPLESDEENRTFGVLTRANSKTIAALGFDLIMLRNHTGLTINNEYYPANHSNVAFLSLKISPSQFIDIHQHHSVIVTIENPTVFTELNKIRGLDWDVAVYTAGKISNVLLEQLAQWEASGHQLIHFGDYDYAGLLEYARILTHCPGAHLFYPSQLTQAFINRYGLIELHQKQIAQHQSLLKKLETLPDSMQKERLMSVHHLLQITAKGLEQEAFLINS